ncbi:apolipoprotein N-acyltransferase [Streptosporangium sp. NPDC002544]|uniref:apolipoprotein N-acyltransferase n=1 Tax=Streptosporangium sp. NPDC002544 TaxID=3154538 RepID=UPI003317EF4E
MLAVLVRWGLRLLALLIGACLALAFPAVSAWWWAWVGLVPLLLLLARAGSFREAAWRSWLAAGGFFVTLHHWVLPYLGVFSVVAAGIVGLVWVPFGLAAYGLLRRPSLARVLVAMLVLPSVWLTVEALRSWKHLGGTWGLLGLSQWTAGPVLAVAALGGVWLLSFLLVAVNIGITALLIPGAMLRTRLVGGGVAVVLAAAAVGYGILRPEPVVTGSMRVAGVQPGIVYGPQKRLAVHLRLTHELAGLDHDVIVWGQSSVGLDPKQRPDVDRQLREAAAATGSDLLVNVDARGPSGQITKSTYQYTGKGLVATYAKQRLAPFGEYIPLRPLLGWIADYTGAPKQDRSPGDKLTTLNVSGLKVGPLISYESTFPDMRRDLARMGADVTIVQGSLTTFHGSWAHSQQAGFEAVRAVESGRPAVLVELDGTSAAFDARGRPLIWVPPEYRGTFIVDVPLSSEETLYVRLGDWVPLMSGAIVIAAILGLAIRRVGRRLAHWGCRETRAGSNRSRR